MWYNNNKYMLLRKKRVENAKSKSLVVVQKAEVAPVIKKPNFENIPIV